SFDKTDCSRSIKKASIFLATSQACVSNSFSFNVNNLCSRISHLPLTMTSVTSVDLEAKTNWAYAFIGSRKKRGELCRGEVSTKIKSARLPTSSEPVMSPM